MPHSGQPRQIDSVVRRWRPGHQCLVRPLKSLIQLQRPANPTLLTCAAQFVSILLFFVFPRRPSHPDLHFLDCVYYLGSKSNDGNCWGGTERWLVLYLRHPSFNLTVTDNHCQCGFECRRETRPLTRDEQHHYKSHGNSMSHF